MRCRIGPSISRHVFSPTDNRFIMPSQATPLVLTIQSHVAYGHVGNDAAMLPLQLLGIEPVAVHTVQFSNHTGYGEFKGQVFTPAHITDVIDGLRARGVLERCTAVLSGYLGDAGVGEAILSAVQEVRTAHPKCKTSLFSPLFRGICN